jgi:CPA2 family monovalent cation:H+ antiporter-2
MSAQVLETLGLSKHEAVETARRFRLHDEATMKRQYAIKDDEKKLIESVQESSRQLEHLFESDDAQDQVAAAQAVTG